VTRPPALAFAQAPLDDPERLVEVVGALTDELVVRGIDRSLVVRRGRWRVVERGGDPVLVVAVGLRPHEIPEHLRDALRG